MNRLFFTLAGALLVMIALGMMAQQQTRTQLLRELADLRRLNQENASRRPPDDQASISRTQRGGPPELPAATALHSNANKSLPDDTARLPLEPNLSVQNLRGPGAWKNAGHDTPTAAFETFEWALDRGEVDVLAASLTVTPETRGKLDALFAKLSEETRKKYASPEALIALLASGSAKGPQAFQVLGETFDGNDSATIRVRIQEPNGRVNESSLPLRRTSGGWKAVLTEQQALEKFTEFFPETVWKTIERQSH